MGQTAQCPYCRRWFAVRLDGRIRRHRAKPLDFTRFCEGSLYEAPGDGGAA